MDLGQTPYSVCHAFVYISIYIYIHIQIHIHTHTHIHIHIHINICIHICMYIYIHGGIYSIHAYSCTGKLLDMVIKPIVLWPSNPLKHISYIYILIYPFQGSFGVLKHINRIF